MDGTEQCNIDITKIKSKDSTLLRQQERGEKGFKRGNNWSGIRRGRMRTVSRDDQLVERGANPRTGLVSPFAVSDESEDRISGNYIAVDKVGSSGPSPERRTHSGKWRQDSLGWSLVESPLSSPISQNMSDKMSRTISVKQLEDRPLAQISGMDDSDPKTMTDEQIQTYQAGIARAYKCGGERAAMPDPATLPSPRHWTPEGHGTPPTKLQKPRRKEVGSGVVDRYNSSDTVIMNANNRASSLLTSRKDVMKPQNLKAFAPSNTPKGSSFESCIDISNALKSTDHFLDRGSRLRTYQSRQNESEPNPSTTLSIPPTGSQTLSEYLPRLEILHPSHFAKPDSSSYRRPKPRVPGQHRRTVEDACIFTTASKKGQMWGQRPKMKRQDGNDIVPRVHYLFPGYEKPLHGFHQEIMPRNKQSYPGETSVDPTTLGTSGLMTEMSREIGPTEHIRKSQMPAKLYRQDPYESRLKDLAKSPHMTQGLGLESANTARERIQRNLNGDGCTPTYGHPGNEVSAVLGGSIPYIDDDTRQANLPAELTIAGDSKAWFAGQLAEVEEQSERRDLTALAQQEALTCRESITRKSNTQLCLYAVEAWVEPFAKLISIQQLFYRMICHVTRTLHHASLTLTTLEMANAPRRDYFRGMRDVFLAAVYLLVLLNLFMILRGAFVLAGKALYWMWHHPGQTILVIIRWCIFG